MKIELVNGTLSKSITRNDSGEVEVPVSGSNDSHGFGSITIVWFIPPTG